MKQMRFANKGTFREIEPNFLSIAEDNKKMRIVSIEMNVYRAHS